MASFEVCGGNCLNGEVRIQGSKNAALPILSACLLTEGVTKLYNCPHIADVYNMIKILENMGCIAEFSGECLTIDTSNPLSGIISSHDAASMRSSVTLMGSLLGRLRYVQLPWPGGCSIGKRPVDLHLSAFSKMNVSVKTVPEGIICDTDGLIGNEIRFPYPSVGATENAVLAAVLAQGTTTIYGAAREPEVIDLCLFLNKMGAEVHGMGTGCITIHGVKKLHGTEFRMMSDRIVAGTYLMAAAATGGNVLVENVCERHIHSTLEVLALMGCGIVVRKTQIRVIAPMMLLPQKGVRTAPFPGFPTDMQSQLMTCLTAAAGESVIYEDVFEDRFKIVPQLCGMGAKILTDSNRAVIHGNCHLHGTHVEAQDLRGGAALVIAGLMAEGDTIVEGAGYIERGYEDICRDLREIGAQIRRI